jgi:hypothetical protein
MGRIYHPPPELWLQTVPYGQVTAVHITGIDDRQGHLGVLIGQRHQTYQVQVTYGLRHERAAESFTDILGSLADALATSYRVPRVPSGDHETAYGFFTRRGLKASAKLPIHDEHYRCVGRFLHVMPTVNLPIVSLAYA